MTNTNFVEELKTKQAKGNLKPSDFKRNRGWNSTTKKEPSADLTIIQGELSALRTQHAQCQTIINSLTEAKNALELALFDKRLENLAQFTNYRDRIKNLKESELTELNLLRNKLAKNTFNLDLDSQTKLIISLISLALFLTILNK